MGCIVNSGKFCGWFGVFGVGLVKLTMVYLTRGWVGNPWLGFSSNGWNDVDSANRRKLEAVCLTTLWDPVQGCHVQDFTKQLELQVREYRFRIRNYIMPLPHSSPFV